MCNCETGRCIIANSKRLLELKYNGGTPRELREAFLAIAQEVVNQECKNPYFAASALTDALQALETREISDMLAKTLPLSDEDGQLSALGGYCLGPESAIGDLS